MEELIRWEHPRLGLISPAEFIPIAERVGKIVQIGNWVLEKGCVQNKELQQQGYDPLVVSVNVSVRQLQDQGFFTFLKKLLDRIGLSPKHLEIEITESVMEDWDKLESLIEQIKSLGVYIAIDDFGKGYGSLHILEKVKADCLKIDRAFVQEILYNSNRAYLLQTIIKGKKLNMTVVAEGIEDVDVLHFLKNPGCDIAQGYYISGPLQLEVFKERFLNGQNAMIGKLH
jgi:EAL domain-containing protein (putative c-di-GMP-specific phosphodiesterase class I)